MWAYTIVCGKRTWWEYVPSGPRKASLGSAELSDAAGIVFPRVLLRRVQVVERVRLEIQSCTRLVGGGKTLAATFDGATCRIALCRRAPKYGSSTRRIMNFLLIFDENGQKKREVFWGNICHYESEESGTKDLHLRACLVIRY